MAIKAICSAIAASALLFSAGAASAAAANPVVVGQSVSAVKAPLSGVRAKRLLKKKSSALPAIAVVAIVAASAGTVAGVAVAVSGPTSP